MTTTEARIPAEQIAPGSVISFLGTHHVIVEVEPYTHLTVDAAFGIARAADGWGITLVHGCDMLTAAIR